MTMDNMEINTSAGKLCVYKSCDPGAPGVIVMLQPFNDGQEIDLVYIEVKEDPEYRNETDKPDDIHIYVYGDVTNEDFTEKIIVNGGDAKREMEKWG